MLKPDVGRHPPRFVPRPPPPGPRRANPQSGVHRPPTGLITRVPGARSSSAAHGGTTGSSDIAGPIRSALQLAQLKLLASKLKLQVSAAALRARLGSRK
jgi:hypothetical protein